MKIIKKRITSDKFKNKEILARVKNLKLYYKTEAKEKLIINDTSFAIREGEILGIIGESGSGKSVITTCLTGLNADLQLVKEGLIEVNKIDVTHYTSEEWQESKLRGKFISQVFQNPLSSLNPYRKIGSQIIESIITNSEKSITKNEAYEVALELLDSVMIHNSNEVMDMYPHQMSGGMNQRVVIVTILATRPKLIIFDEPTTALDPIAQAQIIEIIREINSKFNTSVILISHNISLVSSIADTIAIMYAGKIVEKGTVEEIINYPLHPYTWGLLMSVLSSTNKNKLYSIPGKVVENIEEVNGDPFAERSEYSLNIDFIIKPPKFNASNTHFVWTWLYDDKAPDFDPPKIILEKWKKFNK